jgi:hypothetical protein
MKEHKDELAKQDTKRLLLDEPKEVEDKLYLLYWQYPSFFQCLFDYTGWEYNGEQLEQKIGDKNFEYDSAKRWLCIHNESWKRYYKKDNDKWGIQLYVQQEHSGNYLYLAFKRDEFKEEYDKKLESFAKAMGGKIKLKNWVTIIKKKIAANDDAIVKELSSMYKKMAKNIGCLDNK